MAVDQIAQAMAMDARAAADGKADLVDGKVPASELPSYVDDVVEYASVSAFPATGERGKIYIALDTNTSYRWSGSTYIPTPGQADWNQSDNTAPDYIKNKPTLANVATSGDYGDLLNKPTIPDAQIQSDWNQSDSTAKDFIKNKPTIPAAVTVDQVYDGTSANPQSGIAINSVIGNINTVLEEVL